MSTLTVHDLQGFSTYSNDVRIPSGHKLRIEGNLKLPEWTTATRPSAETGIIGWNSTLAVFEAYNGTEWVAVGDSKPDGSSADKAFDKATDVMVNLSNPATGWYWVKVNGVAKKQWLDTSYDGGGWTMVASNVMNISIPALTYAQAATSTDHYVSSGSTWGSGDPKQYAAWMGLDGWQGIANGNNANRDVVYYVAGSSVPLGSTGSHSKRARWRWTGWGANYDWVGENSLNVELGSPNPGVWSYHISNNYNFTTTDRDQDQYGGNCANLYNRAPWWYGSCWSGSFWGGNGSGYQNAPFWNSSGGDYHNYGAMYVK